MPPLPSVGNVIRISLIHTRGDDSDVTVRLFWQYSGGSPTSAGMSALASQVSSLWSSDMASLAGSATVLTEVTCTDLSSPTGATGTWSGSIPGTRSGAGLPASICALQTFSVARRYRGGKPRTYWPFGTDSDVSTPQTWTTGFTSAVSSAWNTFSGGINAYGGASVTLTNHVNVSYYQGFTTFTTPSGRVKNISKLRTTPVVDVTVANVVNPRFGSQRRRVRA